MSAYLPTELDTLLATLALLLAIPVYGFGLTRVRAIGLARALAWLTVVGNQLAVAWICAGQPAGFRMLAIAGALLFCMKIVVAVEERKRRDTLLGPLGWACWVLAWPGMRPELFAGIPWSPRAGAGWLLVRGGIELGIGVALCVLARLSFDATGSYVLASIPLLIGLSLCLHFGAFDLLAGAWRLAGVRSYRLFPQPLRSRSLAEFWGRRWNLPFTEMIQRGVYRPLSVRFGRNGAALVGFAFSGVLHEAAISLPVMAGFGLPMLYFALHGGLVAIERRAKGSGWLLERSAVFAHVWVIGWLALPAAVLFHPPFLAGVIWPIVGIE